MHLAGLWLTDFRCYREAEIRLMPGVTVISGANAQGKTSLLEAVGLGGHRLVVPRGSRRRVGAHGL